MTSKFTIFKSILCILLLLSTQQSWAEGEVKGKVKGEVKCSTQSSSRCVDRGEPQRPSAGRQEQYRERQDTIRKNKAKIACKKKETPEEIQNCLDNLL